MFFGHQTIISHRFVISFCIYGRKGTYNYRHSQSKWQEKSVTGGCSMHNQRDIDTKRFAAFPGCALCVCGCRQCRREHALGHLPPSPSAPACRQAEKPQIQKVRLWRYKKSGCRRYKNSCLRVGPLPSSPCCAVLPGRLHWQAIAYLLLSFGKDNKRLFFYRRSRTFFTAVVRFLPRGVFGSHALHDCGCGGGDTKENLFSDCRRRHSHKGEAFRRRYGFLYLSHPYGNHPQPHLVCCHRKQIICYMFFSLQTIHYLCS